MSVLPDSMWTLLVSAGVLLIFGVILLKFGLWPRRRGDTPYCRKCGYNLIGTDADRCSECGTTLSANAIVRGERHRRRFVIAGGALMILLASIPASSALRYVNWYRLRPTAWVISDFRSTAPAVQKKAWDELMRRAKAGEFSEAQQDQFVTVCLAEQVVLPTGSNYTADAFRYLTDRWRNSDLTSAQAKQFFEQMVVVCDVEVISARGGRVIYNTDLVVRNLPSDLGRTHDVWFRIREATAVDQNEPIKWQPWFNATINAFRHEHGTNGRSLKAPSGSHIVHYFVEVEVYADGPVGDVEASRPCHSYRVEDRDDFVINADGTLQQIADGT